ncbi:MAG: hypothetical protein H6672_04125 [Anaerolineaceae bacterium]|nr:hypothetical protein [Anaerolineaceae bacterium]
MAHSVRKNRRSIRAFIILVAIVIGSGLILWSQGDLANPLEGITMLTGMSSSDAGFEMVGDRSAPPDSIVNTAADTGSTTITTSTASTAPVETASNQTTTTQTSDGGMTLETFTAELAAAGVDVETVTANMAAEGRSLDNLLAVVNSGRVTVAELAARLNGETTTEIQTVPIEGGAESLDIRWEEIGSVAYNLWIILAATVIVIVVARPIGWFVNQLKRVQQTPSM